MKPLSRQSANKRSASVSGGTSPDESPRKMRAPSRTESPYAESLLERCASTPRLQAFSAAIGTAGLAELLRGKGPITIFAPTDRAFSKIPSDQLAALLGDSAKLGQLLRHHVVTGRVKAPRASKPRTVKPSFGDDLNLTASSQGFRVDAARIVKTNIRATNGVIHAIDTVLDPSAAHQ